MRALLFVALLAGCGTTQDIWLKGEPGARLRSLVRHDAVTISDRKSIYLTEDPPSEKVICHEHEHQKQFRVIADALVILGAIDDDEPSRAAAALSIYALDWIQYGYGGNRFEKGAQAACK